jgi:hypothetical protein
MKRLTHCENTFRSKKFKHALRTQFNVHADFSFWFVQLLEFFGDFLNISQFED